MTTQQQQEELKECREAFEKHFYNIKTKGTSVDGDWRYDDDTAQFVWVGWQAAWNRRPAQAEESKQHAQGMADEHYSEGVNVSRLIRAMVVMGVSCEKSQEAFLAPGVMAGSINSLTRAIEQHLAEKQGEAKPKKRAIDFVCEAMINDLCPACRPDRKCCLRMEVCRANGTAPKETPDAGVVEDAVVFSDPKPAFHITELMTNTIKNYSLINGDAKYSKTKTDECCIPVYWDATSAQSERKEEK